MTRARVAPRSPAWIVSLVLVAAGTAPALAQQDRTTRELREALRAKERETTRLRQEIERLERGRSGRAPVVVDPGNLLPTLPPLTMIHSRSRLGITVRTWQSDTDSEGALVLDVLEDGPAAEAGIEPGDVIVRFGDEPLTGPYGDTGEGESEPAAKLIDLARELEPGDEVELTYRRGDETKTVTLVARRLAPGLVYRPALRTAPRDVTPRLPDWSAILPGGTAGFDWQVPGLWSDLELVSLDPELGEYFGVDHGLLVLKAGKDNQLGLRPGDVLLAIGDREPSDTTHALRILRSYDEGEEVNLHVMRKGERIVLTRTMPSADHAHLVDGMDGMGSRFARRRSSI